MHDVGSQIWGIHQDPGWLFYRTLPELLANKILQSLLDSMCRELTMRLLSPTISTQQRFCDSDAEALELARLTSVDIINGAGGTGFYTEVRWRAHSQSQRCTEQSASSTPGNCRHYNEATRYFAFGREPFVRSQTGYLDPFRLTRELLCEPRNLLRKLSKHLQIDGKNDLQQCKRPASAT